MPDKFIRQRRNWLIESNPGCDKLDMPKTVDSNIVKASPRAIREAADRLRHGGLVSFPTETVYGLGADATSDSAVARIFEVKGRPRFNPLIVHVSSIGPARGVVSFGDRASRLAEAFWPGALSLVLSRAPECPISLLASAGLETLAVRCPDHPVARALIEAAGVPIAAPSANVSGKVSPTTAGHVGADLGSKVDLILDGGRCPVGIESTVVGITPRGVTLLRPGGIGRIEIEEVLGEALLGRITDGTAIDAPGQMESHYAPRLALRLNVAEVAPGEALLAFGKPLPGAAVTLNLSADGDTREAAANLFAMMRELDRSGCGAMAVMPVPMRGLGLAINDRLSRAAAGAASR